MMKNDSPRPLPEQESKARARMGWQKAWQKIQEALPWQKIKSALLNNWGWKLTSIVLAICLWGVLISQDTSLPRDKVIEDVRITVANAATLRSNGYVVVSGLEELGTARIRVSVPQRNYAAASASNYSARLDLSQIQSAGEQTLRLTASAANASQYGTVLEVYNPEITLVTEEYAVRTQVPVEVRQVGAAPEEYYVGALNRSVSYVDVAGPRSVVDQVVRCVVEYDQSGLSPERNPNAASLPFFFEDALGGVLDASRLTVSASGQTNTLQRINLSQQVYYKARVPVDADAVYTGQPAEGYAVSSVRVFPQYVTLAGSLEAISPYLEGDAALYPYDPVNIDGQSRNVTSTSLSLNTPGNMDYISNNTITVVITILPEEFVNLGAQSGE